MKELLKMVNRRYEIKQEMVELMDKLKAVESDVKEELINRRMFNFIDVNWSRLRRHERRM